ncbi:YitT family protein [uncultured Finegoldia sp.]|uniref:YczE/YyaS/YitT family protein n=1 Tax=uncultured Finegoldia sp. TaxID=328009 RepID=UPI0025EE1A3D|nr:hypothetical protein [uncultured Finegoldia sp.]MDU1831699.1 hypothetical protein [Finegoldia magna]
MNKRTKQILFAILGNLIIGFSIGILRLSKLGVDPLSFMNSGFSDFLNKDFGTVITVTNFILIVIVFLGHRKSIGLGTVINMATVGYSADFSYMILKFLDNDKFLVNFIILIIGINIMSIGVGIYLEANLGASAYDAMPYVVNNALKKDFSYKYTRIVLDVICIVVGLIFGEKIGIGTIFLGFLSGPLIVFYREKAKNIIFKKI